jgi:hypothetical protein
LNDEKWWKSEVEGQRKNGETQCVWLPLQYPAPLLTCGSNEWACFFEALLLLEVLKEDVDRIIAMLRE